MPIMFDVHELTADMPAAARDVMCAFCGTLTTMSRLTSRAYVVPSSPDGEALTRAAARAHTDRGRVCRSGRRRR